jgi:hypothetical protein
MRISSRQNLLTRAFFVGACFLLGGCAALPSASFSSPLIPNSSTSGRTWQDRLMNEYVADGNDGNGLAYFKSDTINASTNKYDVAVAVGTCTLASVTIPDTWDGNPVVGIKEQGFAGDTALTSITFPTTTTFTMIGSEAFADTGLSSVTIPDYVTELNPSAFLSCQDLGYVYFSTGNRLTQIDEYCFADCFALERCRLPEGLTTVGSSCFQGDLNLIRMILPSTLTTIGEGAFMDCAQMTLAYFPSAVANVGAYAFKGCVKAQAYFNDAQTPQEAKSGFVTNWDYVSATYKMSGATTYLKKWYSKQNIGSNRDYIYIKDSSTGAAANDIIIIAYVGSDNSQDNASVNLDESTLPEHGPIPQSITDDNDVVHNVVGIDQYAFQNHTELGNIVFGTSSAPSLIKSIGNYAFSGCDNLSEIDFTYATSLTTIGSYAFFHGSTGYPQVTSLRIPASVTTIGYEAFAGFNQLESLSFVDDTTSPSQLTTIGGAAFRWAGNAKYLTSNLSTLPTCDLVLPCNRLTTITKEAFRQCNCFRSVTFKETKTDSTVSAAATLDIGQNAFYDDLHLQSLVFSTHVTRLQSQAFRNINIGINYDVPMIHSIYLPEELTTIDNGVFDGQFRATIYAEVNTATRPSGWGTTFNSTNLALGTREAPNYADSNVLPVFYNVGDGVGQRHLIHYNDATNGTFDFLSAADSTGTATTGTASCTRYYFDGLNSTTLTPTVPASLSGTYLDGSGNSVNVTYTVKTIEKNAFYYSTVNKTSASSLTSVKLPSAITSLGGISFMNCLYLSSVSSYFGTNTYANRMPQSLATMGQFVFYNDPLTTVILPSTIVEIGEGAFGTCTGMTSLTMINSSGTVVNNGSYYSCINNVLYYGTSSGNYSEVVGCATTANFGTTLTLESGVTSINPYALENTDKLKNIIVPSSLTSIGSTALYSAGALVSFRFAANGSGALSIGENALQNCTSLTTMELPNRTTSIGDNAFSGDKVLANFPTTATQTTFTTGTLDMSGMSSFTSLGVGAFNGCLALKNVTLPDTTGFTTLSEKAFYGCTGLTSINLGTHLTTIGTNALAGDTALATTSIPTSVTSINASAFNGDKGLTSLTFGDGSAASIIRGTGAGTLTINKQAFQNCTNAAFTKIVIPSNAAFVFDSTNYPFAGDTQLTIYLGCTLDNYTTANYPVGWNYKANSLSSTALPYKLYSATSPSDTSHSYWHYNSSGVVTDW